MGFIDRYELEEITEDGFYELQALEFVSNQSKGLLIPLDEEETGDSYILELRAPVGFDRITRYGEKIHGVVIRFSLGYTNRFTTTGIILPAGDWLLKPGVPFYDPERALFIENLEQSNDFARARIRHGISIPQE